jgi:hypothetical protein
MGKLLARFVCGASASISGHGRSRFDEYFVTTLPAGPQGSLSFILSVFVYDDKTFGDIVR